MRADVSATEPRITKVAPSCSAVSFAVEPETAVVLALVLSNSLVFTAVKAVSGCLRGLVEHARH